jgi:hypothetical protein
MNCILCKEPSDGSVSVEHIVPESLGNTQFILNRGVLCDKCNNYISVKIEQPLLEMPYFKQFRHDLGIKSKKGKIPDKDGFIIDADASKITFMKGKDNLQTVFVDPEAINEMSNKAMTEFPAFEIVYGAPNVNPYLSKFLCKIGIEGLAYEAGIYGFDESYYNQQALDDIKMYVRRGKKNQYWNYLSRVVHHHEGGFKDKIGYLKVICSWKFVFTEDHHLFLQFLFMGTEFMIDMVGPETYYAEQWLQKNNGRSLVLENVVKQFGHENNR